MKRFDLFYELYKYNYKLEKGWDDEDAEPANHYLIDNAFNFIKNIFNKIPNLNDPDLSTCRNGSLDIYWYTDDIICLINLKLNKENKIISSYYLEYRNSDFKSKNEFNSLTELESILDYLDHVKKLRLDKINKIIEK